MVVGLDIFGEVFADFADQYVVIGGTACDIVLSGTTMIPRATDDIDMILIVEKMTPEFGRAIWEFVERGGYENKLRKRGDGKEPVYELYRFQNPIEWYPVMIELLSRHSDMLGNPPSTFHIEPIPIGEDVPSLSAIILEDDLYQFTIEESIIENRVRIATPIALICLKVRAYQNLLTDKAVGKKVNTKDIKKHRTDVLKLIATTSITNPTVVTENIFNTIEWYIGNIRDLLSIENERQSLEGALDSDVDIIEGYLEALGEAFIKIEKR